MWDDEFGYLMDRYHEERAEDAVLAASAKFEEEQRKCNMTDREQC